MAFDNVTFFELHIDGARIGREAIEAADGEESELELDREPESAAETSRRRSRPPIGFLVLLGIGAVLAARRMRGGDDAIDLDLEDAEAIAVE